jgi:outer membrane protein OmpA-like peptidoglycan-associated protein
MRDGDRLRIVIASITFPPYRSDFTMVPPQAAARNGRVLDRLAVTLKKYQGYKNTIEGHTVMVYWNDPLKVREEQEEVLIPLSSAGAKAVKKALVKRSVREERMTIAVVRASRPIVPFSDLESRWKNRRVEFVLVRQ